jgi:hypothetical protein
MFDLKKTAHANLTSARAVSIYPQSYRNANDFNIIYLYELFIFCALMFKVYPLL